VVLADGLAARMYDAYCAGTANCAELEFQPVEGPAGQVRHAAVP
jgi:hypothetical protein